MSAPGYIPPETISVHLLQPIEYAGQQYETLTLTKPSAAALAITTRPLTAYLSRAAAAELTIRMVALHARMPIDAIELLAEDDAANAMKRTGEFYGPPDDHGGFT